MDTNRSAGSPAHGFTLVEMLIVVVLLGVLAGIVILAVGDSTSNAAKGACRSEAQAFQIAVAGGPVNQPPVAIDGNRPKTDAVALEGAKLLQNSALKYLDDGQALEPGSYATGWTYSSRRVFYDSCA